jgi:putative DNA primase/helicase
MEFISFCRAHGILIDIPPPIGVWRRYPTDDHPRKRNGAVKFMGDHGFVQNHATDTEVSLWQTETPIKVDRKRIARDMREADAKRMADQADAVKRAAFILSQTLLGKHEYLNAKGFTDSEDMIWGHEGKKTLVVPMRVDGHLVGCQLIESDGSKKFLYGQRTSNAELIIDNKGVHILCEGYATALSVQAALRKMSRRYTIHVCFSAGNMKKVAQGLPDGLIVADNDKSKTGERVAKEIGWPYWMSDVEGEDANDTHQRIGVLRFGLSLARSLKLV